MTGGQASAAREQILLGIMLRLGSAAIFSLMNAFIKLAEAGGGRLAEIMFFRQAFALPPVLIWVMLGPGLASLRTQRIGAHLGRTALGLVSMVFVFSTILLLPLAEATTLQFTLPIFATIFGALVLGERVGVHRWFAVALGFAGVLVIAQPGGSAGIALVGVATGLIGASLAASVSVLLRQISKTESAATIVFWFSLMSLPPLGLAFLYDFQPHPWETWVLMACVGICGGIAQMLMTASLSVAPVSAVAPMDYTALVWAALIGWFLFGALPVEATWIGAPLIVASGLYIVWREHVRRRALTEQTSA